MEVEVEPEMMLGRAATMMESSCLGIESEKVEEGNGTARRKLGLVEKVLPTMLRMMFKLMNKGFRKMGFQCRKIWDLNGLESRKEISRKT